MDRQNIRFIKIDTSRVRGTHPSINYLIRIQSSFPGNTDFHVSEFHRVAVRQEFKNNCVDMNR